MHGGEVLDDRFSQQLKKGVLEMLVLRLIAEKPAYGYELLSLLKERSGGLFTLKEGTLYPILYRLEDDKMITAAWSKGEGRISPKKIYSVTDEGRRETLRQHKIWHEFTMTVGDFFKGGLSDGE